ncbi:hypothetical protein FPV67DRAFT_1456077 [Lyophyllum atratum]|nr:hypothetical protein FPV67DRAFT_1456077 [Lyophyllum atratum]
MPSAGDGPVVHGRPEFFRSTGRRYQRDEISELTKKELVALVQKQPECWPCSGEGKAMNLSKTKKNEILEILLDAENGFTREDTSEEANGVHDAIYAELSPLSSPGSADSVMGNISAPASPVVGPTAFNPTQMGPTFRSLQGEIQVPTGQPAHKRDLTLYVEDRRFPGAATQNMEIVAVPVADHIGCAPGAWRVLAKEVVEALQRSHGRVKLGIPENNDPMSRFTRYFMTAAVSDLVDAIPSPEHLIVPPGSTSKITLFVDWAIQTDKSPLANTVKQPSRPKSRKRKQEVSRDIDEDWLKDMFREEPGSKEFRDSKGRVLQNPDLLNSWGLAVRFKDKYCNTTSAVSDHIITKKSILTAIGVRETWYSQAEYGLQLAQRYGEGSEECAQEVVSELAAVREQPLGSHKLLDFLQTWDEKTQKGN